jgi:hypothetical protein
MREVETPPPTHTILIFHSSSRKHELYLIAGYLKAQLIHESHSNLKKQQTEKKYLATILTHHQSEN